MDNIADLLEGLAEELYTVNKTRPIDSPNRKHGDSLMQRARAAAERLRQIEEATPDDAPWYCNADQAYGWAGGFNACLIRFGGIPQQEESND